MAATAGAIATSAMIVDAMNANKILTEVQIQAEIAKKAEGGATGAIG